MYQVGSQQVTLASVASVPGPAMPPKGRRVTPMRRHSTRRSAPPRRYQTGVRAPVPVRTPVPVHTRAPQQPPAPEQPPTPPARVTPELNTANIAEQVAEGIRLGVQMALEAAQAMSLARAAEPSKSSSTGTGTRNNDDNSNTMPDPIVEEVDATEASGFQIPILPQKLNHFSVAQPIYAQVPLKIRQKIWAGEFIDFGLLLNKDERNMRLGTFNNGGDDTPQLVWRQLKQRPLSVNEWTDAFHIFMAITLVKEPSQAASMLKYSSLVRNIAVEGGDWHWYDEIFRRTKESEGLQWDEVDQVSVGFALSRGSGRKREGQSQSNQSFRSKGQKKSKIPKGFCFKFHKGIPCSGPCAFKHKCFKCPASHPISRCPNKDRDQSQLSTSQSDARP